jgi:hypothetical protein
MVVIIVVVEEEEEEEVGFEASVVPPLVATRGNSKTAWSPSRRIRST